MYCLHCGKEIAEGQVFCQFCGGRLAETPVVAMGRKPTAWEQEDTQWTVRGLTATLKESLFSPSSFFRTMNVTGGLAYPLLYALITGMVGWMAYYFWEIVLRDTFGDLLPAKAAAGLNVFSETGLVVRAMVTPFLLIMGLFFMAGILHLLLMLVRGAKNGYEATFRVVSYINGTSLFLVVPLCGGLLCGIWTIVLAVIGLRDAHGTSGGKAAFAVLFPLVLCCVFAVLFSLLVLGTVAASFGIMPEQPWK